MRLIKRRLRIQTDSNAAAVIATKLIVLCAHETGQAIIRIGACNIRNRLLTIIYQANTVNTAVGRFDMQRSAITKS